MSRTRCECLGAHWCYWFSRRHGNSPHLSATAAEGSRRAHTSVYVNAYTHTYSSIVPPLQLSVFFSPCIYLVSFPSASSSLKFSPLLQTCFLFAHSLCSSFLLSSSWGTCWYPFRSFRTPRSIWKSFPHLPSCFNAPFSTLTFEDGSLRRH